MIRTQTTTNIISSMNEMTSYGSKDTTLTTFSSCIPTTTKPVSTGANDFVITAPSAISFKLIGSLPSSATGSIRVVGWNKTNDITPLWIPTSLFLSVVTVGGPTYDSNVLFSDITTAPAAGVGYKMAGSAQVPATLVVHLQGSELLQISMISGTAGQSFKLYGGGV